jgi:hypothetical protein
LPNLRRLERGRITQAHAPFEEKSHFDIFPQDQYGDYVSLLWLEMWLKLKGLQEESMMDAIIGRIYLRESSLFLLEMLSRTKCAGIFQNVL